MTDEKVPPAIRKYLARIGAEGGKKKVPKGTAMLTKTERRNLGKAAAAKRWAGKDQKKKNA